MTFFRQIKFQLLISNRCVLTMNVTYISCVSNLSRFI